MGVRVMASTGAAALVLGSAGVALAAPYPAEPPVTVTGASPYNGCAADGAATQSGTVYPNSEVEPWVAVNPTDDQHLVGAWQQDRWSNGGARGLRSAVSFDGGASWTQSGDSRVNRCEGGPFQRDTDPWVDVSADGEVTYFQHLAFNDENFDHAIMVNRSTDGGVTWEDPETLIREDDANVFNDKNSLTADPFDPDLAYAVWDRLVFPTSERANVVAGFVTAAFRGPAYFTRTTDGGETWEEPREIFDPGQNDQTIGNQIVVLNNGDLLNVFNEIRNDNRGGRRGGNVVVMRSTDQGETWSQPVTIDRLAVRGVTDPEDGHDVRTGDIIPDVAVDRVTGDVYVAWQDARPTGGQADQVLLSRSTDGGDTWSPAVQVNQTPSNIPIGNRQAFTPAVDVASDGTVAVSYYDFRNNTPAASLLTDHFVAHCHSGCATAGGWAPANETRVTPASFDHTQAPDARGYFLGDYEGLAHDQTGDLLTFFGVADDVDTNPSDIVFSRVDGQ
jgi:hypothetical protein